MTDKHLFDEEDGVSLGHIQHQLAATPAPPDQERTFEQVWAEQEAKGYQYGEDALEQVRFGWELARRERQTPTPPDQEREHAPATDERRHYPFSLNPSNGERSYCTDVVHTLTDYWRDLKVERVLYVDAFMRQRAGFRDELGRVTLERDALSAMLLDVQQECIALRAQYRELAEAAEQVIEWSDVASRAGLVRIPTKLRTVLNKHKAQHDGDKS